MFGQNRPTFGAPSTNTFGGFGSNTSTGFGQSAFGARPAGNPTAPFQTNTGFGTSTSLFGNTTATTTQPNLFGTSTSTFGSTPASTGFGTPATNTGFGFGNANTTSSVFGNPNPSTGIFGSSAPTSQATGNTGIFGATSNNTFGAQAKPAFGFGTTQPSGSLFGQSQTQPAQTSTLFGQPQAATPGTSLFGSSGFGSSTSAFGSTGPVGTTVKFNPPSGTDSMMKNNIQTTINTHHQCITCMKEYEAKSLEELRFEDYSAGRKTATTGPQPAGGSIFGSTTTTQTPGFGFGQTQQKPLFGSTTPSIGQTSTLFGQPQQQTQTSAFGAKPLGFPQTSTATSTGFGFGQQPAQQTTSLFGQAQPAKPFGTTGTTSLFGAPATSQPTPAFGAPQTTTSGFGFGTAQPNTGLFGAAKPAFGAATSSTGFGFGQTTTTTTAGTSLFGAKPTTGFGAASAPSFGTTTASTPSFGFGTAGTGMFGASTSTPAFGAKPAGTTPFGATTANQPTLGFGQPAQAPLFGSSTTATAPKQGLFGTTHTGFGATPFGSTPSFGATGTANAGTGLFGASSNTLASSLTPLGQTAAAPADSQLPIHQYILTLSEISQSSDHPLFRKMLEPSGKTEELLKSSPRVAANTAIVPTPPQYRISPHPSNKIRIKAHVNGSVSKSGRRSIFEGMSDEEDTEEPSNAEQKTDFFVPRRSVKKLQLKTITLDSNNDSDAREEPEQSKIGNNLSPAEADLSETDARIDQRNQELDDSLAVLKSRRPPANALLNQSSLLERSNFLDETGAGEGEVTVIEEANESIVEQHSPHPIGIVLRRVGYYTIPSLDDLAAKGLDAEGKCTVDSFTIARRGYGQIFFEGPIDVAELNLDETVFFRHKEVTVYPDDSKKPPLGHGLNRRAEITLDRVWPVDKSTGEYITDPDRLAAMRYEERLARAAHRLTAKFIEYRSETGSWVFRVNHFSKYGLEDSDEENELPAVPAKAASLPVVQAQPHPLVVSDGIIGLGGVSNALMQTATMSITLEEEMRVEDEIVTSVPTDNYIERSVKSPPPVMTQLAKTLGMPSQRVQIMKASFFEPEEGNDFSSGVGSFFKQSARTVQSPMRDDEFGNSKSLFKTNLSTTIYNPPEPEHSKGDLSLNVNSKKPMDYEHFSNYMRLEHVNQSQEVSHKIVPRFASAEIPLPDSYMSQNSNLYADAGLSQSRSFRVGWGPGLQYLELSSLTQVSIVPVKTCDFEIDKEHNDGLLDLDSKNPYVVLLATLLKFSRKSLQNGVPTFSPIPGCEAIASLKASTEAMLKQFKAKRNQDTVDNLNYMRHVWNLCLALWNPLDLPVGSHAELMARKESLSAWLEEVTAETDCFGLQDEEQVLAMLARHDVAGAARLAHKLGDHYLSLLIAQAGSSMTFRGILQRQLQLWADNRSDSFISETRLRIFSILAGIPLWESSSARINTCAEMDWVMSFAHHLWYIISPVGSVADALLEYEIACGISHESNEELEIYAAKPFPGYTRSTQHELADLQYQLVSLFCRRGTRLEKLVNPLSHTWNVNESMLSWLLWQQLQALGYSHLSEIASAQLTIAFAAQLESCGLWQWAVFVYLHLNASTDFIRKAVQDIIGRHVGLEPDERSEQFLLTQLNVPKEWIEEARATKALHSFVPKLQAISLIAAGNYDLAHEVICDQLAPEAILSETYDELEELLAPLASPDRSCMITNWTQKGKIYWNYLLVVKAVDSILKQTNGNDKGVQLEKLTPDLTSLCNQVSLLPTTTPKHRLARTEVAQKAALILKNVIGLQSISSSSQEFVIPPRLVLPQLRQLPVTQDYSLTELNSVVRAYFLELNV